MTRTIGVDCTGPEGYVTVELEQGRLHGIRQLDTLEAVLGEAGPDAVVVVNLAVGHDDPDGTENGGRRRCDVDARKRWGADRPDLPLVPPPSLLHVEALEEAQERANERGWPAPSPGVWRLRERLLALDEHGDDERLVEGRTEATFALLHDLHGGDEVLPSNPRSWKGLYARLKLLAEEGLRPARSTGGVGRLSPQDSAGATALAWTAVRVAAGEAQRLPEPAPTDPRTGRAVALHW